MTDRSTSAILGAVAVVTLLVVAGCGGASGPPACGPPLDGSCVNRTGLFCSEYAGVPAVALEPIMTECTEPDPDGTGTWSTGGCPHARAIGGCRQEQSGVCTAVWLYVGDRASAQSMCSAMGGTWVNP